jgi:hypothetical protein
MFDLAQARIISLTIGKFSYILKLNPPTKTHWLKYFAAITNTSERVDGKLVTIFETATAKTELAQALLADAFGYRTQNNQPLSEIDGWKELIPLSHCEAAGKVLTEIGSVDSEDAPVMLGGEVVRLEALYSANEDQSGMIKATDLVHYFRTPSIEHQRQYARSLNRSFVVGGSRSAKTVWPGGQPTLIDLYDELVTSVEGYGYSGAALTDRESIVRNMDAYHKVAAMAPLFSSVSPKNSEDEE